MTWILAFVFILGAAVVLHEFGHFVVAKLLGIRVETFSVGFGKRIWGRRWGTTDYRLSLVPLGGYVKLGGDESNAGLEDGAGEEIPAGERFDLRPRWQKIAVGVAGPVMNVLTALAIPFVLALMIGVPSMPPPVVGDVIDGSAAEAAGLRPGDRIASFNGREGATWEEIRNDGTISPGQTIQLVVERGGQRIPLTITPEKREEDSQAIGDLGIFPDYGQIPVKIVIDLVEKGSPAEAAGLQPDDQILALDGTPIRSNYQVVRYIKDHPTGAVTFTIKRKDQTLDIKAGDARKPDGKLGFLPDEEYPIKRVGAGAAASYAYGHNLEMLRLTGMALGQVFSGRRSVRDTFSGPIGIAQASKRAAEEGGLEGVFRMLGFLSLNLGIFNLLPIPVLDGGMIFMLLLEAALGVVGMKLSMTMRERIQQVGFVFLLLLMGFVIVNDVTKYAPGWFRSGDRPAATQQK
ncbi:MAG TPA: RIP metalloprotease RseP [Pyrinomonadaceae bacterium]|nr:RIP metalloprotease RseP [Pyrinomonadaceae bacterium]